MAHKCSSSNGPSCPTLRLIETVEHILEIIVLPRATNGTSKDGEPFLGRFRKCEDHIFLLLGYSYDDSDERRVLDGFD
jgi:hypothetical protein